MSWKIPKNELWFDIKKGSLHSFQSNAATAFVDVL